MIQSCLILISLIWPFGQLLSFSISSLPFTIYALDIVVAVLFLMLALSRDRKTVFNTPLSKSLYAFLAIVSLSLLINYKIVITSGIYQTLFYALRLLIYPSIYFAISFVGYRKISKYITISVIIFSLLGLIQYLLFPDMRFLKNLGFDDHYFRLIGSLYDPNYTGALFCCISLFLIAKKRYLYSIPLIGLLALTFSRASYLGFAVGLAYILISQKKIRLILFFIILALTIFFIPKPFGEGVNLTRTFSIFSRIESWKQGFALFVQKPLLGWGYNTLRGVGGTRFAIDNSFLFVLATTGLAGLAAYLSILIRGFRSSVIAVKPVIVSLFVHALFNNTLLYIWITAALWLLFSIQESSGSKNKS
ncbi:MAG TPA: O-antigen ligase family protein [Candidatus Woesebacteria bacterium]|nr:O-antigen ligase family protein [Candidatus Woesebacteria bacterium]